MKPALCAATLALSITSCAPGFVAVEPTRTPATCGRFTLFADLPSAPSTADVYWQLPIDTSLDESRAQGLAQRVGVSGITSTYTSEGGELVFAISDGTKEVTVFSDDPVSFTYSSNSQPMTGTPPARLYQTEELAKSAEAFLQERALLDFEHRIERAVGSNAADYSVRVVPMLSGFPLYENDPRNSRIEAVFDANADIWQLFYNTLRLNTLGTFPLRPADEAWAQVCLGGIQEGLRFTTYDTEGRIEATSGDLPIPGESTPQADLSSVSGQVNLIELVYYPFDFRGISVNAFAPDALVRLIQPAWRFVGQLDDATAFDILAPALKENALQSILPPTGD